MPRSCRKSSGRQRAARLIATVACTAISVHAQSDAQRPVIRTSVDLVLADVQVVDGAGHPVTGLSADQFEVTIDGRKQRVLLADFVTAATTSTSGTTPLQAAAYAAAPPVLPGEPGRPVDRRIFVIAVDSLSFTPAQSAGVTKAAAAFVDRLTPADLVGVFTYPTGPQIDPTTDRALIASALSRVRGARDMSQTGRFLVRPSEIVDMTAADAGNGRASESSAEVVARECGRDGNCAQQLWMEVRTAAQGMDAAARVSLGGLRSLLAALRDIPGHKTMVLLTGGMVASDLPGGRPDISDLSMLAGQDAARSDVLIYSVFIDQSATSQMSAEQRSGGFNRFTSSSRDVDVLSRWFDQFSGTAGGTLIRDQMGDGAFGFDRILNETSASYRLGIEPTDAIRDGRPHEIRVKVNAQRVTVRSRRWVVIPAR